MHDLLVGVLGNLISALIIGLGALAFIAGAARRLRPEMIEFFGLRPSMTVNILLSHYIPAFDAALLPGGAVSTGWIRETVAMDEYRGAEALRDFFDTNRVLISVMSVFEALANGRRGLRTVRAVITTAPHSISLPDRGTVVLLGTGARDSNKLSEFYLGTHEKWVFRFIKGSDGVRAFERRETTGGSAPIVIKANEHEGWELAVLQRITGSDGRIIFLCAGKDAPGSRMAAEYLAANWFDLYASGPKNGNGDFCHLYRFKGTYEVYERLL